MDWDFTPARDFCAAHALTLAPDFEVKTARFLDRLLTVNEYMNLTAITEPAEVMTKHVVDSLTVLAVHTPAAGETVCDVGCGAGFPGVILKLARPDLRLSLLDATKKKLSFIEESCRELGVSDIRFLHMRAEEAGRQPALRERFGLVTARAVAALPALAEYCLPLVRAGGVFLAMKGAGGGEEAEAAKNAIGTLGGAPARLTGLTLPGGDARCVVAVQKLRPTPDKYPRQQARITKSPL